MKAAKRVSLVKLLIVSVTLCVLISPAVTSAQVFRETLPIAVTLVNPCVPEDVFFQGQLTITIDQSIDQAGGSHFGIHELAMATGTGSITSASYNGSGELMQALQLPGPPQTVVEDL